MQRLIEKYLKKSNTDDTFRYGFYHLDVEDLTNLLKEFGKEICELQKQECFKNFQEEDIRIFKSDNYAQESILDAKNVCDE